MRLISALLLLSITFPVSASLKIATASNFKVTLNEIVALYSAQSDQEILISSGSTGVLYNQIQHGAPFDLFLSADKERARLIEQSKFGINGSRFTYAQGKIAFWIPKSDTNVSKESLLNYEDRVSIANPALAPYGLAAKQALSSFQLWDKLTYIQGANIAQTYQFIDTGNIEAGFVALALLLQNQEVNYYQLPIDSYEPILQQGVMLSATKNQQALKKFVDFIQSDQIKKLIRSKGYL